MAAQELRWLTYLLTDLGEPPRSPPVLYVDNKAMLALCREQRLEHRTKHIALRYFLARELQQRGQLRLAYVASEANTADVFTKALAPCDHQRFCTQLGLLLGRRGLALTLLLLPLAIARISTLCCSTPTTTTTASTTPFAATTSTPTPTAATTEAPTPATTPTVATTSATSTASIASTTTTLAATATTVATLPLLLRRFPLRAEAVSTSSAPRMVSTCTQLFASSFILVHYFQHGAASASAKRRSGKGKGGEGGSSGGGGGSGSSGGGSSGDGGGGGTGGGSGGSGGGSGGSGGSGGGGGNGTGGGGTGARRVGFGGSQHQQQQRRSEIQLPQQLREWFLRGASRGSCPYVIRTGDRAGQTCGRLHTQHRCFSRLDDTWHAEFGDNVELPHWADLLRSRIAIFDLDFDAILSAMYTLSVSAEHDCYQCVLPDPGIAAAALGASESGTLPGPAPAQALHTFTLDSSTSAYFFRDSTTLTPLSTPVLLRLADPSGGPVVARSSNVLPCPAVPSGSVSGLHLPLFSANLVSTAALQDAMVTTTTPGGQRVTICTCTRTGRHLATFTRRPRSSLYTRNRASSGSCVCSGVRIKSSSHLLLVSPPVAPDSSVAPPTGSPLPARSCLLVSGLPRSLPPLPPSPAPPCLPCVEGRQCAAPHSSSFPPTTAPLQTLHMNVKGQVVDVLIPWICTVRLQLRERFGQDLPVLRLHSDRGGEFSSSLLRDFCRGEGNLQSSRAFVHDTSADKLSTRAIPYVFLGFVTNAPGWQFYHPTSRRVFPSQDVTFDEDHFLSLCPTTLTIDLLEERLLVAETSITAIGASRGDPRTPFFEGCSPVPLLPSVASATAVDLVGTESVSAASAPSERRRISKAKRGKGAGGGSGAVQSSGGSGGGEGVGVVAEVGASVAAVELEAAVAVAGGVAEAEAAAAEVEPAEAELCSGDPSSSSALVRPLHPSSFVSGTRGTRGLEFPDATEIPRWHDLLKSGVAIFDLDFDAILAAMYAVSISAEGDCYVCVPPDPGIEAAALGPSESAAPGTRESVALGAGESALSGTASAQVFHTFTLDSGASRSFFRDRTTLMPLSRPVAVSLADPSGGPVLACYSTVLPCPAALSGSLSGLYLPSFSTNLVSGAGLQDAGVDQFTPASQRVTHCTCAQTGRHLATFTRRPGSSLYTLTTESPPAAASGQVTASSQVFAAASRSGPESAPCSCRLLSHQTLLWHHRLGHPSLPRLRGMASRVLVSGLPRSLPPLPPGPAPTCVPCVKGRQRAAPHSSEFPPTEAPLQTLHMDVWGPAHVRGQGHERYFLLVVDDYSRYTTVFPLRSKGEVTESFPPEGIRQMFTLPASPQQNGIAERRIGMVMDVARTSMIHAAAPHFLCPFAVQYAAHQINLQPRVSLPETPPTPRWMGQVGDASAFRVWGSRAFVQDLSADKLSSCAVPCVFLSFTHDAPGWQFYHPTSRRVLSSQDVTFDESVPYYRLFPYRTAPLPPPPPLFLALGPPSVDPLPPQGPAPSGVSQVDAVEPVEVAADSGASRSAEPGCAASGGAAPGRAESGGAGPGGAEPGGAGSGGAEPGRVESRGAEPECAEPGGTASGGSVPGAAESGGVEPTGTGPGGPSGALSRRELPSPQELHEWFARRCSRAAGAGGTASAGGSAAAGGSGAGGAAGAGTGGFASAGGARATGPGGARTGGTGAAGPGGALGAGATGGAGAGGAAKVGATRGSGAGAAVSAGGPAGAGGAAKVGADAGGTGVVPAGSGGAARPRPYFVLLLEQVLGLPPSPSPAPSLECPPPVQSEPQLQLVSPLPAPPYAGPTGGLAERREPESRLASPVRPARTSRRVPRSRPPAVPGTHQMALRPSTVSQRVPLPSPPASSLPALADPESDSLRAASPTVTRVLATVVTDPSLESTAAPALVTELVDFAAHCRLDFPASLVADTDVLEDRQEEFQCFGAALPHLVSTLLALEGDLDAPDIPTPCSYAEAIEGPYSSQWQAAMDAEMASWKFTDTYVDEVPPPGANIVSGMWIFRVKRSPGSPPFFKARYVARGFSQRKGVDYFQTFSPTPKMTTLRVLLHVPAQRDYELHSLDFSTAFLQGSLHEEIWLRRPPGFTGSFPPGTQWSLRRPVYGLHQVPREWHDTLRTTLAALGFALSTADPSLFLRTDTSLPPFYILVYVDNLLSWLEDHPGQSTAHHYSDSVTHGAAGPSALRLHVLLASGHSSVYSLSALPSDESVEPSGPYPELVGCLMYLMTCTRPDLAYPLSILARYVAPGRHRPEHMAAAKRVLRYLCSTSGLGLVLGGRSPVVLTGHADASWVDDLAAQRSSQGYTFSLGSGSVSWRSTYSSSDLSSSCEAEIYAGAMAAQELRWLTYLLTDLGEPPSSPPVLYVDNKAMLALCREHRLEHRTKHIALRYFLARELQQRGQLRLAYVASEANTADIFTKALQPCDHQRFCTMLGFAICTQLLASETSLSLFLISNFQLLFPTRPSSVPLRVPLPPPPKSSLPEVPDPESDRARAASPTVARLLATAVTDPSFESAAMSALVAELHDFAIAFRLDYATALVAESASASPASVGGECALRTDVLEDRQEEFECFAAAVPRFASMLLAHEGDPNAPDIPTPCSYAEAITAFLQGSRHEEIWLRRLRGFTESFPAGTPWSLKRPIYGLRQAPHEWHDTQRTTHAALGFAPANADPSLFLRTDTSLPPFYNLVYVDDLVFSTGDTEALTLLKSELLKRHTCTDLGELRNYFGLQITRDRARRTITLTQSHMVHQVLQRFGFQFSSPQPTPLSTSHSLSAPPSDESVEPNGPYPELVGCLISSCEAEIYAGAMAAQELRWLTYLLTDLGEQPCSPLVLYVDNKAMIALSQEHRLEHRTKHIALRYFLARELQQCGQLRLAYVASRANTADILTKALLPGFPT
ncbi:unnamed protein product, partial [Closterium sp. NIES-54]